MMETLVAIQRWIHGTVGDHLSAVVADGYGPAFLAVVPLGIVLGAIHALTPGHSKMLLASYLVGSRLAVARGLAVSSVLAATHVVSAVVVALFATQLLTRTLVGAGRAPALEDISRGLLVAVGVWFVLRASLCQTHHRKQEGVAVGFVAGLVPCPLTLFVMVLASSRGVAEAGLVLAACMMVGIALTLGLVAWLAVVGRGAVVGVLAGRGLPLAVISRGLDGLAGLLLVGLGMRALLW